MVGRLIRVALAAYAETSFQNINQTLASINGLAFKLEWLRHDETASSHLASMQYDVCLVDTTFRLDPHHDWNLNVPIILLCHHGQPESLASDWDQSVMDWLPLNGLSAAQLERSIRYVIERHRLLEALRVAQDAADSAQRMQGAFLATMSDEIRTPMNGVIGMAELLMETELTEEQHEYAATIRNSGHLLSTVIDGILDLSKLKSGSTCLEQKAFKLRDLADGVITLFTDHAHHQGIDLEWSICEDVPAVLVGDPSLVRHLLIHLVSNAVKFTPAGHIDVRIMLDDETEDEVFVCFEIEDTGIGIPIALHDRLFQPFSQADSSNTRQQGGTGLGLAIAQHIATAMKGSMTFESEPGQGSTFWCKIHLRRALD